LGPFFVSGKKKVIQFLPHQLLERVVEKVYTSLEEGPILGIFLLLAIIRRELIVKGVKGQLGLRLQYLKLLESFREMHVPSSLV
jgi:hypothetical protein